MIVWDLDRKARGELAELLDWSLEAPVQIGFDDEGVKVKVGAGTWSPAWGQQVTPPTVAVPEQDDGLAIVSAVSTALGALGGRATDTTVTDVARLRAERDQQARDADAQIAIMKTHYLRRCDTLQATRDEARAELEQTRADLKRQRDSDAAQIETVARERDQARAEVERLNLERIGY
jgi:hypothetical protein